MCLRGCVDKFEYVCMYVNGRLYFYALILWIKNVKVFIPSHSFTVALGNANVDVEEENGNSPQSYVSLM